MKKYRNIHNGAKIALSAVMLSGLILASGCGGLNSTPNTELDTDTDSTHSTITMQSAFIDLSVEAEGWTEKSTPVIAHIEGEGVDFYHAFNANEAYPLTMPEGSYTVTYISPVNPDGSMYKVPEPKLVTTEGLNTDSTAEAMKAFTVLELIPTDKLTEDQKASLIDDVKKAIEKGDETLSGDLAVKLLAAVEDYTKLEIPEEEKQAVIESSTKTESPSVSNSTGTNKPTSGTTAPYKPSTGANTGSGKDSNTSSSKPTTGNSASSGNNSSSNNSGTSGGATNTPSTGTTVTPKPNPTPVTPSNPVTPSEPEQPSEPVHSHSWVAQYKTVTVPAVTEEVWVENMVRIHRYTCGGCGTHTYSYEEAIAHQEYETLETGTCYAFGSTGYWEDNGYYETVVVTPETTEKVLTGYTCSCGATKN